MKLRSQAGVEYLGQGDAANARNSFEKVVAAHPELKRPMYAVPHTKGVIGTAANFVLHLAERMRCETHQSAA